MHIFVAPEFRASFIQLFAEVLGCEVVDKEFGMSYPITLVSFPDGSRFSVEYSELAPNEPVGVVDDTTAFRGAWIEFRTDEVELVQRRLRNSGVPEFQHPGSSHVYFSAPGGQVFRVIDSQYQGP